jgi:hypothetical protein
MHGATIKITKIFYLKTPAYLGSSSILRDMVVYSEDILRIITYPATTADRCWKQERTMAP